MIDYEKLNKAYSLCLKITKNDGNYCYLKTLFRNNNGLKIEYELTYLGIFDAIRPQTYITNDLDSLLFRLGSIADD